MKHKTLNVNKDIYKWNRGKKSIDGQKIEKYRWSKNKVKLNKQTLQQQQCEIR